MRPEAEAAAARYGLALPGHPLSGRAGERLGRGTGSSLEFMDYRDYVPGDDLRHVDWRAYARTDQLKVRLFREEVSPIGELIVDLSPSMAVTREKEQALRDLVGAFRLWLRRSGRGLRGHVCGAETELPAEEELSPGAGALPGDLLPRRPLRPRSLRVLISDFLFPGDPAGQIRRLAADAAHLWVVQLLDPWELEPTAAGPATLVDCETEGRLDLVLEARTIAGYQHRLALLGYALHRAVRRSGGTSATVRADAPARMFREGLLAAGIVEPAA